MTRTLRDTLRQLADDVPSVRFPPDLYHRARRTHRRRVAATSLAVTTAVILTGSVAAQLLFARKPTSGEPTTGAGGVTPLVVDHWLSWLCLGLVLAGLGWWWRRRGGIQLTIRLVAVAVAGTVLITTAPPGIAWWGEPRRAPGLPSTVVVPSTWTARATDAPPGRVAVLFGGSVTRGNIEEGRIALVAGDGERYRVLEQFMYEDPGEASFLSPDGRYVSLSGRLIDLTTGEAVPDQPSGVVIAWSRDSTRYLYRTPSRVESPTKVKIGVWDLKKQRDLDGPTLTLAESPWVDELLAALSPDGTQFAVQERGRPQLQLYRVGERVPYRTLPVGTAQLGGSGAWTPDGRGIALAAFSRCTHCPLPWYPSQWELTLIDPASGQAMPGHSYPALASVTHLRVLGWRSDNQPVVAVGDPAPPPGRTDYTITEMTRWPSEWARRVRVLVLNQNTPPEPLLTLPPGVEDVDIASDYLTKPVYQAHPATFGPPNNPWLLGALGCTIVTLILIIGGVTSVNHWAVRERQRNARSSRSTAAA